MTETADDHFPAPLPPRYLSTKFWGTLHIWGV